jgi:hypothetical protein
MKPRTIARDSRGGGLPGVVRRNRQSEQSPAVMLAELRPKSRGDCNAAPRPCPWVGCRYHTYLDATTGGILMNRPALEVWELGADSCALDLADRGAQTPSTIGRVLNVTAERVRQLEEIAIRKLRLRGGDF